MKHYFKDFEWKDKLSKKAFDIATASDPVNLYEKNGKIYSDGLFKDEEWNTLDEAIEFLEFEFTDGQENE